MLGDNSDIETIFREIETVTELTEMELETAGLLIYIADRKNIQTIKKLLHRISIKNDIVHTPHKKNYFLKALRIQVSETKSK